MCPTREAPAVSMAIVAMRLRRSKGVARVATVWILEKRATLIWRFHQPLRKKTAVGENVAMSSLSAVVRTELDGVEVSVQPLLRFWSRSPDRGWTLFVRPAVRGADDPLTLTRALDT